MTERFQREFWTWRRYRGLRRAQADRGARLPVAERAAAEAVTEDAAFDAEGIRTTAGQLFVVIKAAWDAGDRERLARYAGAGLMAEWAQRLDDFASRGWRERVKVLAGPDVELISITNAAADTDDRAVVHVAARLRTYVMALGLKRIDRNDVNDNEAELSEYWTLAKHGDSWQVIAIEQEAEGAHHLTEANVATPWADARLRDTVVAEAAAAQGAPEYTPAELADADLHARAQAEDLALADARFDPDLIEATVRRGVAAWADGKLEVAQAGPPGTRVVVRGPRVEAIRIVSLDASAPAAGIEADLRGHCYLEESATGRVAAGSRDRDSHFTVRWTLVLDGAGEWPWRVAAAAPLPLM